MTPQSLGAARRALAARLAEAGLEDAALEARLLIRAVTGLDAAEQAAAPERALTDAEIAKLDDLAARRAAGEPVAHLTGCAPFWTLELAADARALIPRADTETIVRAVLARLPEDRPARVLDLGTGTGAILLAVLSERPLATGAGVDASEDALALARENAALTGLAERTRFVRGDWTERGWAEALGGPFDLVVSNPPYIRSGEIAALAKDVRADPHAALDGGADGLDAYRILIPALGRLLSPGGAAVFEIGWDQGGDMAALAKAAGVDLEGVERDLEGRPRAAIFRL